MLQRRNGVTVGLLFTWLCKIFALVSAKGMHCEAQAIGALIECVQTLLFSVVKAQALFPLSVARRLV